MKSNPNINRIEALTSFLILDHLEKSGISSPVRKKLAEELNQKGLFEYMLTSEGGISRSTFNDVRSQLPESNAPVLKHLVYNQYQLNKQRMNFKRELDDAIVILQKKYNILDPKERRDRLRKKIKSRRGYLHSQEYPPEIFTHYWNRFKSIFGHAKKEQDPDDPINGSPVYNLIYDKTGRHVISAADDGIVKVWSTENGELINTLIGHTSDINATALSDCGTYLASCSNDGLVRLWRLENGLPIAVFRDHSGVVCSLNFFSVPFNVKGERTMKKGLASASDDGTIKIYFEEDFANNNGLIKKNQKHITLKVESGNSSKGFSSIEFHPEGFIAAGTNWGSIVIWNKLSEIDHRHIDKHRIIKNEHSKDCHLTLWNKQGTMLLSASFDGTAKVWPWDSNNFDANREMASIFIFEGELGKGIDIKCCAVAWSSRGRYAIASFCKKLGRRHDENSLIQSNIQIYDSKVNKRVHKFDKTYDGTIFENYVFILEPHPFNEAILMSADYDGKIIIWDIERGVMLNCFIENCAHLGCPLLQAPILDGRFSPDGLSFCVANYYGSITLYGYGEKDLFLTTPVEQFYSKEFVEFEIDSATYRVIALDGGVDMHDLEKGALCSSKKRVYYPEAVENPQPFEVEEYYKRYLEALEKIKHEGNQEIEGINSKDCLKALKIKLHELLQQEIEKALENFYGEALNQRSFNSPYGLIDAQKIAGLKKNSLEKIKIRELKAKETAIQEIIQQQTRPQERPRMDQELALQEMMFEGSDYNPPSDDERTQNLSNRPRRRRSNISTEKIDFNLIEARRLRTAEEEDMEEEETIIQIKKDKEMVEEDEDHEERTTLRKSRKLLLDDDEEKEEEVKEERRYATRRSDNRTVSGRRNRQLASDSAIVREVATVQRTLRGFTRNRTLPVTEEVVSEVSCSRCGQENARIKCTGGCEKHYHSGCSKRNGKEGDWGGFMCFTCLLKKRRSEKVRGAHINREWVNMDSQHGEIYLPQVGDLVTYVFQAHEDFIVAYFEFLRFSKGEVFPFEKRPRLFKENTCKITNIKYHFPFCPKKYKGALNILMKITLEIIEPNEFSEDSNMNNSFTVTYFANELGEFLVPRKTYLKSINLANNLVKESQIMVKHHGEKKLVFLSEISPKEEGTFPDSQWDSLRVFDHEEGGYMLRKPRNREQSEKNLIYISPWDVIDPDGNKDMDIYEIDQDEDMNKELVSRILKEMDQFYDEYQERYEPFMLEVDKMDYPTYLDVIPLEMNIKKVQKRLENMFYRYKQAIIADIQLISDNCSKFNDPKSLISILARELAERLTLIVKGELNSETLKATEKPLPEMAEQEIKREEAPAEIIKVEFEKEKLIEEEVGVEEDKTYGTITTVKEEKEDEDKEKARMALRPRKVMRYKYEGLGIEKKEEQSTRLNLRSSARRTNGESSQEQRNKQILLAPSKYSTRLRSREALAEAKEEEREKDIEMKLEEETLEDRIESLEKVENIEKGREDKNGKEEAQEENKVKKQESNSNSVVKTQEKRKEETTPVIIRLVRKESRMTLRSEKSTGVYTVVESFEDGEDNHVAPDNKINEFSNQETTRKESSHKEESNKEDNKLVVRIEKQSIEKEGADAGEAEEAVKTDKADNQDGDYKHRLRNPGRHLIHLYSSDMKEKSLEEGSYARNERPKRKQNKQQEKLQKKQTIRQNTIPDEEIFHMDNDDEAEGSIEAPLNGNNHQGPRGKHSAPFHPKPDIEEEESQTKVRLVLPKSDDKGLADSQMVPKRYNTRSLRNKM